MIASFIFQIQAQTNQQNPNVIYNPSSEEIVFLNGADSVAKIPFNNSFRATLNHEKKRKRRTIYYRLAEYSNPINIFQVPVVIANSDVILHLVGTLQEDTSAEFSCIFRRKESSIILEISTSEISSNQISFQMIIDTNVYMTVNSVNPLSTAAIRKKRKLTYLTHHDKKSMLEFNFHKQTNSEN